jgi:hypothetical protein
MVLPRPKPPYNPSSTGADMSIASLETCWEPRMNRYEESCPFDERNRAARCETCCATNNLPPCAAAFLSGRAAVPASNVIPIRRIELVESRRAA